MDVTQPNKQSLSEKGVMQKTAIIVNQNSFHLKGLAFPMN